MAKKNQSIFKRLIISLSIIIIFEAVLLSITIWVSGIEKNLIFNEIDVLKQEVKKRELALNLLLMDQKAHLKNSSDYIDSIVSEVVHDENVVEYLQVEDNAERLLGEITPDLIASMRDCSYSGMFVVLSNGEENVHNGQQKSFKGVYFRNTDVDTSEAGYSDILAERGSKKVFKNQNIDRDNSWEEDFTYFPNEEDSLQYYFKPYEALMACPGETEENLGYWSDPFYLNDERIDSHKIITYSMPLIAETGEFYGVIGIEVPICVIDKILEEISSSEENVGYALVSFDKRMAGEPNCNIKTLVGSDIEKFFEDDDYIKLINGKMLKRAYKIKDKEIDKKQAYALSVNTQLYEENTYFSNEQWAILAITNSDKFFGLAYKMRFHITLSLIVSVVFGIWSMYIICKKTIMPIRQLSNLVNDAGFDKPIDVEKTGITEIDDLYQALNCFAQKRIDMETQIKEEKGRFLIALQSSADIIFEYDVIKDVFYSYNFRNTDENGIITPQVTEHFNSIKNLFLHPDDLILVHNRLNNLKKSNDTLECRMRKNTTDEEYEWFRINSKVVVDEENESVRIIGNFKNIDEEKKISLAREEAAKRDYLTDLYNEKTWWNLSQRFLYTNKEKKATLALIDMDDFTNINQIYGMLHCDMLLANIGNIINKYVGPEDLVARIGGDEFVIFFIGEGKNEAYEIAREISKDIKNMYIGEDVNVKLSCSIAIVEAELSRRLEVLLEYAEDTISYIKYNKKGGIEFYNEEMHSGENNISYERYINAIISNYTKEDDTLATFAFNAFEHANDINSSINVFLSRMGSMFGISKILIQECDKEFCTMTVKNQWAREKDSLVPKKQRVTHYKKEEMEKLISDYVDNPIHIVRKKGETAICNAIFDNGELYGDVVLIDEDENRVWTEEELQEIREIVKIVSAYVVKSKYDAVSRAKGEFLSRMSHEIRTPMNAIIGMTHIAIQERDNPERLFDCLKKIDSSTKYLLSIINDILDMSRIESGKMSIVTVAADMRKFIEDLSVVIKPTTENKNINFVIENNLQQNLVYMDTLRVNQVLINLLGNAVKFTPENGEVRLAINELENLGDYVQVRFEVIDTGIGISEENQTKIFNSFEQAEDSTAMNYGGTGLGLAISANLVKMMGGVLKVSSEIGKGSDFYFTLKLQKSTEEINQQDEIMQVEADLFKGKKILLVEDNEINIEIAEELLKQAGFEVEKAMNGQEAVDKFSASKLNEYDAILMDVRMPVMDGLEATKAIRKLEREDSATIPIIAMSANAFDEDIKKSVESGMNGHLAKPVDIAQLYSMLKEVILDSNQL